ncbi:MAG: hypothetical protein KME17_27005 [Cyanosarcina radialis HA8281-LM2]|nr:hypothetical protein [Cyanosarcina radialis HA8281-LM2]
MGFSLRPGNFWHRSPPAVNAVRQENGAYRLVAPTSKLKTHHPAVILDRSPTRSAGKSRTLAKFLGT